MSIKISTSILKSKGIIFLVAALFFFLSLFLTFREVLYLQEVEKKAFDSRANRIQTYIDSYRGVVYALAETFKSVYEHEKTQSDLNPAFDKLREYPQFKIYGISGMSEDQGYESLVGTLTGRGEIKNLDERIRREMSAALGLDAQFAMHVDEKSELVWIYYTSVKNFIYIAPKKTVAEFHFDENLYDQVFWLHALPSANPKLLSIITPLYEDTAGQGLMTTISVPVVIDDEFLGVLSVDIGIRTLRTLLASTYTEGESILITSDHSIISQPGEMTLGKQFNVNLDMHSDSLQRSGFAWWLIKPIVDKQLILAHRIDIFSIVSAALLATSYIWLLFFAFLGLAVIF